MNEHDYTVYTENGEIFALIHCEEDNVHNAIKALRKAKKSLYNELGLEMPKKFVAHQNYTTIDIVVQI